MSPQNSGLIRATKLGKTVFFIDKNLSFRQKETYCIIQQESQQESVGHEICINEEANNANHTSSVEHTNIPISISYASTETEQLHQQDIHNIESEGYPGELNNNVNDILPDESDFRWDEVHGNVFCQKIDRAYEEIVHW